MLNTISHRLPPYRGVVNFIWAQLYTVVNIPAGPTLSYAEIAKRIGVPKTTRAVAQTCDANRFAVAIFCHRVVKNNGSLPGYRRGVACKRALLQKEERYL